MKNVNAFIVLALLISALFLFAFRPESKGLRVELASPLGLLRIETK